MVNNVNQCCENKASHFTREKGNGQKVQRAAGVHGRAGDVERESGHGRIHQDTEVVTQVGASDAQSPHTGEDEHIPDSEQAHGEIRLVDGLVEWLGLESFFVQPVTEEAQGEDCEAKGIASSIRAAE